ncbi:helix-turn-helix domain-containing protein [Laspinema olomoucense]|uniref:helix-turn-helix domain-containing protein n=1 Tax=Laspinema olomoucense TaxID=3231600 RepID=UPI0021BBA432|nr:MULTISPECIES: helix-turn-helix domain-containing protein [unclassified Laspinema]MCT7973661.1 helix-turn-helix domain-containing protein [Laspinema sp. D3d]MCT7996256.1 helix-turn-helix domain-containing protein [Laspinema sp. D3c]
MAGICKISTGAKIIASVQIVWARVSGNQDVQLIVHDCLEIRETEEELKKLLSQEKTLSGKERLQLLYLLKAKKAKSVTEAAEVLGRNRVTLQDWLKKYREGGLRVIAS